MLRILHWDPIWIWNHVFNFEIWKHNNDLLKVYFASGISIRYTPVMYYVWHNNDEDTLKEYESRQFWGVHLILSSYCIVVDAEIQIWCYIQVGCVWIEQETSLIESTSLLRISEEETGLCVSECIDPSQLDTPFCFNFQLISWKLQSINIGNANSSLRISTN